jgi:hypothetical protein
VEPDAAKSTPTPPKSLIVNDTDSTPFSPTCPGRASGAPSPMTTNDVETVLPPPLNTKKPAGASPSKVAVVGPIARADAAMSATANGNAREEKWMRRRAAVAILIGDLSFRLEPSGDNTAN